LAEDFGLTETNVKQKLFRTRNRLKQYLETEGIRV
jgi:DNA-directed RNA polymerase specialized sigma24 family protein